MLSNLCKQITKRGKPGPGATVCSKRKEGHCLLEKEGKHDSAFPPATVCSKRKEGHCLLEKEGEDESAFPLAFPAPEGQIVPLCSASALAPGPGSMISQQAFFSHFCLPSACPLPLSLPLPASATTTFSSLPLALLFLINNLKQGGWKGRLVSNLCKQQYRKQSCCWKRKV